MNVFEVELERVESRRAKSRHAILPSPWLFCCMSADIITPLISMSTVDRRHPKPWPAT